jgi:hypothetical protein
MFHDMMLLKLQVMNGQHAQHMQELFHSHWPGADVVPINGLRPPYVSRYIISSDVSIL